jgi:hypothetical protein
VLLKSVRVRDDETNCKLDSGRGFRHLLATEHTLDVERVRKLVANATSIPAPTDIHVKAPDLFEFDSLLTTFDKECPNHDQNNKKTATRASRKKAPSTAKPDRTSQLTDQLKELRLPTIRDRFQESAVRAETENLSHQAYLSELTTLEDVLQVPVSRGYLAKLCNGTISASLPDAYEELTEAIPEQSRLGSDESSLQNNGKKHWI